MPVYSSNPVLSGHDTPTSRSSLHQVVIRNIALPICS